MIAPLRERLKSMTFKEKADYMWEYYKLHFIAIIAVIATIIYIINSVTGNKEIVLNVVFVGETVNISAIEELNQELTEALIPEEQREDMEISLQYVNLGAGPQHSMAEMQKFTTLLSADAYDVIISEEETYELLSDQGAVSDLNREADLEETDLQGHEVIESETGQPIAIRTREMDKIDDIISIEEAYLYLPSDPQNTEYIQPFVQYLTGS